METFKAGFVSLVGKPNVGKSSILNSILEQKIAIVTPKVQTTRHQIKGIHNYYQGKEHIGQMVIMDLPGIHKPLDELGKYCLTTSYNGAKDSDIIWFCLEAHPEISRSFREDDQHVYQWLKNNAGIKKLYLIVNKIDQIEGFKPARYLTQYESLIADWKGEKEVLFVSAMNSIGLDVLLDKTLADLPEGQAFYEDDVPTDKTMRFLASELIREQALLQLDEEIPHAVTVLIDEYREVNPVDPSSKIYIKAKIIIERDSQKRIVIGKNGQTIKQIGMNARKGIEELSGESVYLELQVKVNAKWRKNKQALEGLGYQT